jgi:23S rRNA (cytidine1920-2'-O)/16S rRNA (cytidine1409-2'-O)-methyltransferase
VESPFAGGVGFGEFFILALIGLESAGEEQPLAAVPKRQSPKRLPRSTLREMREPHEDSEAAELAHAGQHGPARSKRRNKNLTNE